MFYRCAFFRSFIPASPVSTQKVSGKPPAQTSNPRFEIIVSLNLLKLSAHLHQPRSFDSRFQSEKHQTPTISFWVFVKSWNLYLKVMVATGLYQAAFKVLGISPSLSTTALPEFFVPAFVCLSWVWYVITYECRLQLFSACIVNFCRNISLSYVD